MLLNNLVKAGTTIVKATVKVAEVLTPIVAKEVTQGVEQFNVSRKEVRNEYRKSVRKIKTDKSVRKFKGLLK